MVRLTGRSYVVALVVVLGGGSIATAEVFDDFKAFSNKNLGGWRSYYLSPSSTAVWELHTDYNDGQGALVHSFQQGDASTAADVSWSNFGEGLNIDLQAMGAIAFEFDLENVVDSAANGEPAAMMEVLFIAMGPPGNQGRLAFQVPVQVEPQTVEVTMDTLLGKGFDWTNFRILEIRFNHLREKRINLALTEVRVVVPEPVSLAVLAGGGVLVMWRRR